MRWSYPSPRQRPSHQREEEGCLGEVGISLEVPDGLCLHGLFPAFHQEPRQMHLLHVPKAPGQHLTEQRGRVGKGTGGASVMGSRPGSDGASVGPQGQGTRLGEGRV